MCLITSQSKPCVAEHDIVCYKTLTEDLVSPYFNYQYVLGEKIESVLNISQGMVSKGLHTFVSFKQACQEAIYWHNQSIPELGIIGVDAPIVVKCIIPQGSHYYVSLFDIEYASNQLIPLEIIYDATENAKN